MYRPLFIRAPAGLSASSGIIQVLPAFWAPLIRPPPHSSATHLGKQFHFSPTWVVDRYLITGCPLPILYYIYNSEEYQHWFMFRLSEAGSPATELLCHRYFCFSVIWYKRGVKKWLRKRWLMDFRWDVFYDLRKTAKRESKSQRASGKNWGKEERSQRKSWYSGYGFVKPDWWTRRCCRFAGRGGNQSCIFARHSRFRQGNGKTELYGSS